VALVLFAASAYALDAVDANWRGLAISGYDPVAYFSDGKPVEGSGTSPRRGRARPGAARVPRIATNSLQIRPSSRRSTAAIAPGQWRTTRRRASIPRRGRSVEGKLYLNYSKDVQAQWEKDVPGYLTQADKNWPPLLGGK